MINSMQSFEDNLKLLEKKVNETIIDYYKRKENKNGRN